MLGGQARGPSKPIGAGGSAPLDFMASTRRSRSRSARPLHSLGPGSMRGEARFARVQAGTSIPCRRWLAMTDPELRAQSFEIAWTYLDRSGLLSGEPREAARFILNRIDRMMLRGERRRLLLSNAAIDAYRLRADARDAECVSKLVG